MSKNRYAALLGMFYVVDYTEEDQANKLHKVDSFIEHFRSKFKQLFQPYQNIAVYERLVKSKHRSCIRSIYCQ